MQTEEERLLWQRLRNRQMANSRFRRQHVIGSYIVDFVCLEKHLIVEFDGGQHLEQQDYDDKRTHFLVTQGFDVIRFWNDEVLKKLNSVLEVIYCKLVDPHPSPLPERERE
ncbi:MAG: endonuclease domain-containing protein [Gammaproteobacteria bacterium]|nr:endonuclease domain-containing protein [Gammaproteobacteria bacterium]